MYDHQQFQKKIKIKIKQPFSHARRSQQWPHPTLFMHGSLNLLMNNYNRQSLNQHLVDRP